MHVALTCMYNVYIFLAPHPTRGNLGAFVDIDNSLLSLFLTGKKYNQKAYPFVKSNFYFFGTVLY